MNHTFEYPFQMRPLSVEEGGGWLISFPDLPGCMSDGETPEEAMSNGKDALEAWIAAMHESGKDVPKPGALPSGKFIARVPRSMHARLAERARQEGVSMNSLVSSFLAESLGRRDIHGKY
ncbi:MAG TPA: type II toxin-antitoxin system HicB family antitoxin [Rhodanobacteraceae bacterium]|nr:type II toxin-antitoxin system HicB family antitoxin [Rhodanobacteraceae bacterium]